MAAKQTPKKSESDPVAEATQSGGGDNFVHLQDVDVTFSMELGSTELTLDDVTELGEQSLIELDKTVGEPIDVLINGRLFARGEVVTVAENFGVRLTEIVGQAQA